MLTVDQYEYIRITHRVYDKGIREITREMGHSHSRFCIAALRTSQIEFHWPAHPRLGIILRPLNNVLFCFSVRKMKIITGGIH